MQINDLNQKYSKNRHILFKELTPGFPVIEVNNDWASATVCLYGGQLLSFQPHGQIQPVFWLSDKAIYQSRKAIRGGIPLCWPWFGENENHKAVPAHGFARISLWQLDAIKTLPAGETQIDLFLPCGQECRYLRQLDHNFNVDLRLRLIIGQSLVLELNSINLDETGFILTEALHSYFNISHINNITIEGLESVSYLDKLQDNKTFTQIGKLQISQETDKVYLDTHSDILLNDPGFKRSIIISKSGSESTVVWNPWFENSTVMSDMPDDGWKNMICVEVANAASNQVLLESGKVHRLKTSISIVNNA